MVKLNSRLDLIRLYNFVLHYIRNYVGTRVAHTHFTIFLFSLLKRQSYRQVKI